MVKRSKPIHKTSWANKKNQQQKMTMGLPGPMLSARKVKPRRKPNNKKDDRTLKEFRIVLPLPADTNGQIRYLQGPRLWNTKGQKLRFSIRSRQVLSVWVRNAGCLPPGYIDTVVGQTKNNVRCIIKYNTVVETMAYMRANPLKPTPPKPRTIRRRKVSKKTNNKKSIVQPAIVPSHPSGSNLSVPFTNAVIPDEIFTQEYLNFSKDLDDLLLFSRGLNLKEFDVADVLDKKSVDGTTGISSASGCVGTSFINL
jgi:hypothetical protein